MHLLDIRKFGFLLVLLVSVILIPSCNDDEPDEPDVCVTTGLTYDNYANAFLASNCATSGCHDADGQGGTIGSFDTYEGTKAWFDMGRVKGAINHQDGFSNMPKGEEKLSDCDIDRLSAWIDAGIPE